MNLFFSIALGTVTRSLILAALCAIAVWLLRGRSATLRFSLWQATLLSLFALPVLLTVTPPLPKAAHPLAHIQVTRIPLHAVRAIAQSTPAPHSTQSPWLFAGVVIFLTIAALLVARLIYNLLQLQRLARQSEAITDSHFLEIANELWLQSGASFKPRFMLSQQVSVPITFSSMNDSWVLLPPTWPEWEPAKLHAALTHELAHVQRGDSNALLLASLATCLFWFHPLSWFLQRQLSRLAEQACDEAVLATAASAEQYAQFLISFSQDVQRSRSRLAALPATAVVRKPNLQYRLEKLFHPARPLQRWLTPILVTLFIGAFYLTASTRLHQSPENEPKLPQPLSDWQRFVAFSPADIAKLQASVQANPDDIVSRLELMVYFAHEGQEPLFLEQSLWLIQNHPALEYVGEAHWLFPIDRPLSESARQQIRDAWERAVEDNPDSQPVILNAASFIERTDALKGLELLRKARALSLEHRSSIDGEIAMLYAAAEMRGAGSPFMLNNIQMNPAAGEALRKELADSRNPELLALVSQILPTSLPNNATHLKERGAALLALANHLDPEHRSQRLERQLMFSQTATLMAYQEQTLSAQPLRISPRDSEPGVISRVQPIYPEAARAAHIQGIVELKVIVGTDGHVKSMELRRGDPALVNAAKNAVRQWVFQPATQDGVPVEYETQIMVSFTLSN